MTIGDRQATHQIAYFFYLPRICNHCSRPACLEACPYKKIYFNEERQVAQHCIGCFPRLEKGIDIEKAT